MLKRSTFLLMWHSTVAPSTLLSSSSSSSSSTALLLLLLSTFTYSFALFELTCSVYVSVHMHEHFTSILHIISTAFYKYRHNVKVFSLSLFLPESLLGNKTSSHYVSIGLMCGLCVSLRVRTCVCVYVLVLLCTSFCCLSFNFIFKLNGNEFKKKRSSNNDQFFLISSCCFFRSFSLYHSVHSSFTLHPMLFIPSSTCILDL